MAAHHSTERACGRAILHVAVVINDFVIYAYRDRAFQNFQDTVPFNDIELRRHIIALGICHHRGAADGVRQVAHIRAARVACRQATHSEDIATNVEFQCLKARHALLGAVIHVIRTAVCHHVNRVFVRAVIDG